MYKIRGSDQKDYGPVSGDVVRQWIADGRANAQTLVQVEGSADWKPLSQFPEFSKALNGGTRPRTSGMAIASLVLGCLGFCGITAIVGLILGIIAQSKIRKSNGRLTGSGLAIAGICVSGFMLFVSAGLFLPALAKAKERAQTINCANTLKQLGLATIMYAQSSNDKFPPAATWCDAIHLGNTRVFHCVAASNDQRSSYGFNLNLDGKKIADVNPATVLLFEIDGGWNVNGGPVAMISRSRHHATYNVAFVDGSVRQVPASQLANLRWDP